MPPHQLHHLTGTEIGPSDLSPQASSQQVLSILGSAIIQKKMHNDCRLFFSACYQIHKNDLP